MGYTRFWQQEVSRSSMCSFLEVQDPTGLETNMVAIAADYGGEVGALIMETTGS
jgi:hypothetical protein